MGTIWPSQPERAGRGRAEEAVELAREADRVVRVDSERQHDAEAASQFYVAFLSAVRARWSYTLADDRRLICLPIARICTGRSTTLARSSPVHVAFHHRPMYLQLSPVLYAALSTIS